jgi:hypothetical protein
VPNKAKIDTTWKITERMRAVSSVAADMATLADTAAPPSDRYQNGGGDPATIDVTRRDSMDSVCSDAHWIDKCRVTTLRSSDPEVCGVLCMLTISALVNILLPGSVGTIIMG